MSVSTLLKTRTIRGLHTAYHYLDAVVPRAHLRATVGAYPRYLRDRRRYEQLSGEKLVRYDDNPQLGDWTDTTPADPHYTHQDAWAAREIFRRNPNRHVDVGSRITFVIGLAAFVPVTFVDVRPLALDIPNVDSRRGDILSLPYDDESVESISSLHVVEHVGLGRYGDPLDPQGTAKAIRELARVVAPGGVLYLSLPVGRPRVAFNAHRVLDPVWVVETAALTLGAFSGVDDGGRFRDEIDPRDLRDCSWGCGLFRFER